jgi:hypothetical protein
LSKLPIRRITIELCQANFGGFPASHLLTAGSKAIAFRRERRFFMLKRMLLSLIALGVLATVAAPAQAQHRYRHCWWHNHHRVCRWR